MSFIRRIGQIGLIGRIKSGRKSRILFLLLIILIILPLAINTLLNVTSQSVKADSFFKFDEGYGTSSAVNDSNGTVSAGSITNAVWKTEDLCKTGKCLYFDGTGDYVSFADNVNLDMAASDEVTVNLWFRTGDITSGTRTLISKYETTGGDGGYQIYMNSDGKIVFGIDSDNSGFPLYSVTSANAYDDNRWHFLSAVKNGTTALILYVDALHQGTTGISSTNTLNDDTFYIGIDNALANGFTGFIDEVRVTRSARSESEVKTDYLGGTTKAKDPGLVGHWSFNENTGTVAYDKSGNVNNGSISNAGWTTGNFGSAVSMSANSVTENVTVSDPISGILDITAGMNVTFQAWVKTTSVSESPQIIRKIFSFSGSVPGYVLRTSYGGGANGLACLVSDDAFDQVTYPTAGTGNDITNGNWHHVACVFNRSSGLYLYYDGVLVGSDTSLAVTDSLVNSEDLIIGEESTNQEFGNGGSIDDVKIYNYARTQEQIQEDMNQYSPPGVSASFGPDNSWLSNGLVGYWKMDESSGSPADSSGNGGTLTLACQGTGCTDPSPLTGKYGNGLDFDPISTTEADYAYRSVVNIPSQEGASVSIGVWIKPDTTQLTTTAVMVRNGSGSDVNYGIRLRNNNELGFQLYDTAHRSCDSSINSIEVNNWNHAVVVFSQNQQVKYYVNGSLVDTVSCPYISAQAASNLVIGANFNSFPYSGAMDELRIYNRALSPAEVADLYNWAPGPVGWWKMDEGSGTNAYDSSGNGNTGTLNGPAWQSGKFGKALKFNGTSDYINAGDNALLRMDQNKSMTLSAWINLPEFTGTHNIIRYDDNDNHDGDNPSTRNLYQFVVRSDGKVRFQYGPSSGLSVVDATTALTTGQWHYITAVRDVTNDTEKIYINGVLDISETDITTGTWETTGQYVMFGGYENVSSEYFNGLMDDVKIYNYARTPAQIIEDMNAGHPAPGSPVSSALGHWKFDEGYGDTAYDSGTGGNDGNLAGTSASCPTGADDACPSWTSDGKFGKAMDFEDTNTDDRVEVTNFDYDIFKQGSETAQFTMSAWVNLESVGSEKVIVGRQGNHAGLITRDSAGIQAYMFAVWDNASSDYRAETGDLNSAGMVGVWNHLVGVYDNRTLKIYLNGVLKDTETFSGTMYNYSNTMFIGGPVTNYGVDGKIDEVKIYNFALTADQVKTEYNQGMSAVFGAISTDESGTASFADLHGYCPPGQSSACVGPVSEWNFNEGSGASTYDTSGNGNTGSITGAAWTDVTRAPAFASSLDGKALDFDGIDDQVVIGDKSFIDNSDFTYTAWVNLDSYSADECSIISKWNSEVNKHNWYIGTNGSMNFEVNEAGGPKTDSTGASTVTTGSWQHLSVVVDITTGDVQSFYKNGVPQIISTNQNLPPISPGDDQFTIGRRQDNNDECNGRIDNVRIYNYERTPAQIAWDYNRGGPVAWYRFDECSGTNANDTSGNNLAGTIVPGTGTPPQNTAAGSCSSGNNYEMWNDGTTGKYGASLGFDGLDDYVNTSYAPTYSVTDDFSIAFWYKSDLTSFSSDITLVGTKAETGTYDANILIKIDGDNSTCANDNILFQIQDAGGNNDDSVCSTTAVNDTNWHHVAVTYDVDNDFIIYVDGDLEGADIVEVDSNGIKDFSGYSFFVGARNEKGTALQFFQGQIDEVKFWNYELTKQQINNEYNQGSAVRFE